MSVSVGRSLDRPAVGHLWRFFVVDALAAGLQSALLWTFVEVGELYYVLAAVVAIEITVLSQYVVDNAWTFRDRSNDGLRPFLGGLFRTNLVRGSAIPIQTGLLFVFVDALGLMYSGRTSSRSSSRGSTGTSSTPAGRGGGLTDTPVPVCQG